jgi:hypothetical protein
MDPLTLANAFATIVQLIGVYRQENQDPAAADQQKFLAWLDYHHHEEIKNLICNTAGLQTEVLGLLRRDSAIILSQLDSINTTLATLLSQVDGFKGLTKAILPSVELSDQAVSLLGQLVASGTRDFVYDSILNQVFLEATQALLQISEPIFLGDDIDKLARCGLISEQPSGSTDCRIYGITRAGAKYIEVLAAQRSTINPQPAQ